jgi:hypothetical protein
VSEVTEVYALRHISRRPSLSFFFLTHESWHLPACPFAAVAPSTAHRTPLVFGWACYNTNNIRLNITPRAGIDRPEGGTARALRWHPPFLLPPVQFITHT